jgi:hypothetical protein
MQIDDDATPEEIKAAYRYLAKQCHPDQRGDIGHDMCVLLNEVNSAANAFNRPAADHTGYLEHRSGNAERGSLLQTL